MPFSKRKLTWGEEVFAGLIVLVLIIAAIVLWFVHATGGVSFSPQGPVYNEDAAFLRHEREIDAMAAQMAAQANAPGRMSAQEMAEAANTPVQ